MASSSSSSSSRVPQIKHDVFISFRGSDIRHGLLSHLTKELRLKQIDAYVDERLKRGDEISSALLNAIEASEISLIIFSKHYASSKWCLEELEKIIECKEANGQIVLPIFYNIDPSNVRHQKGTYGDAFAKHERRFQDNMKLQIWRSALTKVAKLSGYHYPSNFENESELIDKIVRDVLEILDDTYSIEQKHLVGFNENLACAEELLEIESQNVLILGIWGMGGIGKTTLARALCEKFSCQFESCCFLENIREESKKINGLSYLLQKLLYGLLGQENLYMNDVVQAKFIRRRLRRKKVLIVLDDVDTLEQLEYLAGELCLGPGSRVIVTSRDKHVLISTGIQAIYEVKKLDFQGSLKLLSLNAFNQRHPKMGYEELSKRAVIYAEGIPLALKVLGSHFHSRNIEIWESTLRKLQKYPNMQIQNVLKVSYDGLDEVEKNIFLDIAFFFQGRCKDDVTSVLDACGLHAHNGIASLVDKSLITISSYREIIEMHGLLQEMAEQIVREESIKDPGRRSRLEDVEEIYDVLKNNTETNAIEGIILDLSQIKNVHLSADAFKRMTNLRILKFYKKPRHESNVNLPFGIDSFSNKLRYFHWDGYPLKSLPLGFYVEKLVELHMEDSNVRKLWDGVQDLVNLKILNLEKCQQLIELPDFSMARNLEEVNLKMCKSLCSVHPSILSLHTLVDLCLHNCKKIKSLQSDIHLKSLEHLDVGGCHSLEEFSLSSKKMRRVDLHDSEIVILHSSIGRCNNLVNLRLNGSRLKSLPFHGFSWLTSLGDFELRGFKQVIGKRELHSLFDNSRSLGRLWFIGCDKLTEIPNNISALTLLVDLSLHGSNVESIPASIKHLSKLVRIYLGDCKRLRSIMGLPPLIQFLDAPGCTSLETVCIFSPMPKVHFCHFRMTNCVKLDEHSIFSIMEYTFGSMLTLARASHRVDLTFCYPGSRVPKWIRYDTAGASITVEGAPPIIQCLGIVFCCVVSQLSHHKDLSISCRYFGGGRNDIFRTKYDLAIHELGSDHVFLWYGLRGYYIIDNAQEKYDNYIIPGLHYYEFSALARTDDLELEYENLDHLIKACGVWPLYC